MDTTSIIVGLVTALGSVAASLALLLKFYLPRHDKILHNPHLEELQAIHKSIDAHEEGARKRQKDLLESLDRIERKVTKD